MFAAGFAVGVGLMAWRLSSGPVSIEFLSPYIEDALSAEDGAYRVHISDTVLTWAGWQRAVEIRALGLRAERGDGQTVAAVPEMTVHLSARALLKGLVAPTRLDVLRPRLRVVRTAAGGFAFGLDRDGEAAEFLPGLVRGLLRRRGDSPLGYLTAIRIEEAGLVVEDRYLGRSWYAPRLDITLESDILGVRANLTVDATIAGHETRLHAVGFYDRAEGGIELALDFADLEPAAFARQDASLAPLAALRLPLEGKVQIALSETGELREVGFDIRGGSGAIDLSALFRMSLAVSRFEARGRLVDGLDKLILDAARIELGGPVLDASGEVRNLSAVGEARLSLALHDLSIDRIGAYWPENVAVNARRWVLANMRDGVMREVAASIEARMSVGGQPEFEIVSADGAMLFENLTLSYLEALPPVRRVGGTATFDMNGMDFTVAGGVLEGLRVERGRVRLSGFQNARGLGQRANVTAVLKGDLADALEVIDREPLGYARELGVVPDAVSGETTVRLSFNFPLIDALTYDQVDLSASARLAKVTWRGAVLGADATEGALDLKLDKQGMKLKGRFDVAGTTAKLNWSESFEKSGAPRRKLSLTGRFDDAARAALGLDAGLALTGAVGADIVLTRDWAGMGKVAAKLDLVDAAVELPGLECRKTPGAAGRATLVLALGRGGDAETARFDIDAGGFAASGRAGLGSEGAGSRHLDLHRFTCGETDITARVTAREGGGFHVSLGGAQLDLSKQLETGGGDQDAYPQMRVEGRVARLVLAPGRHIADAEFDAMYDGEEWRRVVLDGRVGDGKSLSVRYLPEGAGSSLEVKSDDAGATLRALGLVDTVIGGALELTGASGNGAADGAFEGRMQMTDYRVVNAPTLARLLTLASLTGIADALSEQEGMGFSEFVAPFTYADNVIRIVKGIARGPDLGITLGGKIDLARDETKLRGTVAPAYTLNSVLGILDKIPLIGTLLVGEQGSGVFAATYRVTGSIDEPKLTVNPLAALTPGILRNLFDIFSGDGGASLDDVPLVDER